MVRRRLTIKRIDPWSVLKFGAVANVVLFVILMLVAAAVWYIIDRLRLIDQACQIALDLGFSSCGVDGGSLFKVLALLGGMGVIVMTVVLVFLAFLHNLIADLTGGIVIGAVEDGSTAISGAKRPGVTASAHGDGDAERYAAGSRKAAGREDASGHTRAQPGGTSDDSSLFGGR
ncbi:MAG: DUF3566 domain-containing protein [Nitriliruptoraceae bacterium]